MNLEDRIKLIRLLILDVDGVLTDGSIILDGTNSEYKAFDVQDGMGIKMVQSGGIRVAIITSRVSEAVKQRADELQIQELYQGESKKIHAYRNIIQKYGLRDQEVAYMGDDITDLPILHRVGLRIAVATARDEVKSIADYVTRSPAGRGAVREVTDLLLKKQNKWNDVLNNLIEYDGQRVY